MVERPETSSTGNSRRRSKHRSMPMQRSSVKPDSDHRRASLDDDSGTSTRESSDSRRRRQRPIDSPKKGRVRSSYPKVTSPLPISAIAAPDPSRGSSHSQPSVGSAIDESTHSAASASSVQDLRRSIQSQSPRVPPAFRAVAPPSPRTGKSQSAVLDNDTHSSREGGGGNRGGLPLVGPSPVSTLEASRSFEGPEVTDNSNRTSSSSSRRPPTGRPSVAPSSVDIMTNFSRTRSQDRPGRRRSASSESPLPQQSDFDHEESSSLPVNLIDLDSGHGDKSKVSTYNKFLESVVNSDLPETQKGLDVLATMEQNGVRPDETTWELIDQCFRLRDEFGEDEEHDDIIDSGRKMRKTLAGADQDMLEKMQSETIQKVALYSSERTVGTDARKTWRMEQDLALMPPAFRSSILAMLRRKGYQDPSFDRETRKSTSALPRRPPPIHPRSLSEPDTSLYEVVPSVADRKKKFTPEGTPGDLGGVEDYGGVAHPLDDSLAIKPAAVALKDENFARIYKEHGVVKYMRPDGYGDAARPKEKIIKSVAVDEDEEAAGFAEALSAIDETSGLPVYAKLLSSIARSSVTSKASLAGKVLKKMKDNSVAVDEKAKLLLAECLRIRESPREPKPHELEMEDVVVPQNAKSEEDYATPTQVIKKRVRFADTNSFRFIRRRRSIGSNERWDDPLTPPKRVNDPVDLAQGRFSSGQRDDRPSLPRRSNSMNSLLSASSHSAYSTDRSSSSSDTADSIFDEEPIAERFKLPFADFPDNQERKQAAKGPLPRGTGRPPPAPTTSAARPVDISQQKNSSREMPVAPVRRSSNDDAIFWSPTKPVLPCALQDDVRSPISLVPPPPPVDDPEVYKTPSPKRRPVQRRRSISGTERRWMFPLTPPRRVSAPLDIFIAQEALKSKAKAEVAAEMKLAAVPTTRRLDSDIVKGIESIKVSESPFADNSDELLVSVTARTDKNALTAYPTKASRRDEVSKRPVSAATNAVRKSKPTKAYQTRPRAPGLQGSARPPNDPNADSGQNRSPLARHKGKMPEHWKRMELRNKIQMKGFDDESKVDDASAIQWSTYENQEGTSNEAPVSVQVGHSANSRRGARSSRRNTLSTTTAANARPKTKPSEAPSWQRVLRPNTDDSGGQSESTTSTSRKPYKNSSSDHGIRTAFSRRKEESRTNTEGQAQGTNSQTRRRRAARRTSLPA